MKLKDKVAVVTGGAMGNGLGIAKVFLKYGAKVAILDYSDTLDDVVSELKQEYNDVSGYKLDIRNMSDVTNAINDVVAKYGYIDILRFQRNGGN